jgi:hypothetical protein
MSGSDYLTIQPSKLAAGALAAGQWARGIPTPGTNAIAAVEGVPGCGNLVAASPPTLLCEYSVYSYSIGFGLNVEGTAAVPNVDAELAILVNDRVAYITSLTQLAIVATAPGAGYNATGAWVSDLVNPIRVGARERLGLRVGIRSDQDATSSTLLIGVQVDQAGRDVAYESTLSYNVIDLPGSRRL